MKRNYKLNALLLSFIFIIILVVVNLISNSLITKYNFSIDMTSQKNFNLSQQTIDIVKNLKDEVTVYAIFQPEEQQLVNELLLRYPIISDKLILRHENIFKDSTLVERYKAQHSEIIASGSIIVENGDKYKIITENQFFQQAEGYEGMLGQPALIAEQEITAAILAVTGDKKNVSFTGTYNEDLTNISSFLNSLRRDNIETKNINFMIDEIGNPDALIINAPKADFTQDDIERLETYFEHGGKILFMLPPGVSAFENLNKFFNKYGINVENTYVIDLERAYQSPLNLIPEVSNTDVTSKIAGKAVMLPGVRNIKKLSVPENVDVKTLLTSGANSYTVDSLTNLQNVSDISEAATAQGPFDLGVVVTKKIAEDIEARMIVIGNSAFLDDEIIANFGESLSNLDLAANSVAFLVSNEEVISIRPMELSYARVMLLGNGLKNLYTWIFIIIIPLAVIVTGLVIWLRRRHK